MPFVALDRQTSQRIDITRFSNPRQDIGASSIICPLCGQDFHIVQGVVKVHHFRHNVECTSDFQRHPESFEHLRTKLIVAQQAGHWFSEFTNATPELEVPIPEANRVADVLFSFPNGWRIACEVQLASITPRELQQRTDDYHKAGIDSLWFLGKSTSSPANIAWSVDTYGFVLQLNYRDTSVSSPITPPDGIEL